MCDNPVYQIYSHGERRHQREEQGQQRGEQCTLYIAQIERNEDQNHGCY